VAGGGGGDDDSGQSTVGHKTGELKGTDHWGLGHSAGRFKPIRMRFKPF
jgi:hypothetical protein